MFAGCVRFGAGILIGVPFAYFLLGLGVPVVTVIFSAVRFLLWVAVTLFFFRRAPVLQVVLLAALATLLNWGIDFVEIGGHWANLRMC